MSKLKRLYHTLRKKHFRKSLEGTEKAINEADERLIEINYARDYKFKGFTFYSGHTYEGDLDGGHGVLSTPEFASQRIGEKYLNYRMNFLTNKRLRLLNKLQLYKNAD